MILALDVGNTWTVIGCFKGGDLVFKASIESARSKTEYEYAATFHSIVSMHGIGAEDITGAIISSVVPKLTLTLKKSLKLVFGTEALIVGPGIKTGVKLRCDDPASVGADLVCASAASSLYTPPCLIIDMGTATKMIYINSAGEFEGVVITAGIGISLDALIKCTSQLPEVTLEAPKRIVGKNTADSIRSGAIYGSAAMLDGMIDRITAETGGNLNVIGTGEQISLVAAYCKHSFHIDENLLLKGLNIIYNKNASIKGNFHK